MTDMPHLDAETLVVLKEVMEDEFQSLVDTFLSDAAMRLTDLRAAYNTQNTDSLRRAAHSFKGSSGNVGALRLAELCLQIEQTARSESLEGLDAIIDASAQELDLVKQAFDEL